MPINAINEYINTQIKNELLNIVKVANKYIEKMIPITIIFFWRNNCTKIETSNVQIGSTNKINENSFINLKLLSINPLNIYIILV